MQCGLHHTQYVVVRSCQHIKLAYSVVVPCRKLTDCQRSICLGSLIGDALGAPVANVNALECWCSTSEFCRLVGQIPECGRMCLVYGCTPPCKSSRGASACGFVRLVLRVCNSHKSIWFRVATSICHLRPRRVLGSHRKPADCAANHEYHGCGLIE